MKENPQVLPTMTMGLSGLLFLQALRNKIRLKKADTTALRENRGIKQNTITYSTAPRVKEKLTKTTVAMVMKPVFANSVYFVSYYSTDSCRARKVPYWSKSRIIANFCCIGPTGGLQVSTGVYRGLQGPIEAYWGLLGPTGAH